MSKYYTPEIEEFHVGFEFEYRNIGGEWEVRSYPVDSYVHITQSLIDIDCIRVKYLDREDIESFGFDFKGYWIREEEGSIYHNDLYGLTYFNGTKTICIWERMQQGLEGENYFRGKIKNKSGKNSK
jgi:hypothetical protein